MSANRASRVPKASKASRTGKEQPAPQEDPLYTIDRLKAVADPIRMRFLMELGHGPRTVKEVAEALEVPATRLYYHLKILESQGLVKVANRRMISGIEERSYTAVSDNWTISPTVAASALYETGALRALFDVVRAEIEVVLQGSPDLPVEDPESPLKAMALTEFAISPEDLPKLIRDFQKFLEKYAASPEDDPELEQFHFFYALYPGPTSIRKDG